MNVCPYCSHPEHRGGPVARVSVVDARKLWPLDVSLYRMPPLTAAQCEAVLCVWDQMPNDTCWAQAFRRIQRLGTARALSSAIRRYAACMQCAA